MTLWPEGICNNLSGILNGWVETITEKIKADQLRLMHTLPVSSKIYVEW